MKKKSFVAILSLFSFILLFGINVEAQQQSVTFPCSGFPQYFSVPPSVTQISAELVGSDGNAIYGQGTNTNPRYDPGGKGARVTTNIAVTPGQLLTIYAGCQTGYGFTRGGRARLDNSDYLSVIDWLFTGGGSSAILNDSTVLTVAGGGGTPGEAGYFSAQAGGGDPGNAIITSGNGGNGGGSVGGNGGTFGGAPTGNGEDGTFGNNTVGGGGGGGGGYDPAGGGGGGGGRGGNPGGGGGGGGGKSYANPSFTTNTNLALATGNPSGGSVKISYNGVAAAPFVQNCTNNLQTYTVPNGVRSLLVTGIGGDGGGASVPIVTDDNRFQTINEDGDDAGVSGISAGTSAVISVVPGEQLTFSAGCAGNVGTRGGGLDSTNPGGSGGFGYISGGRGGDGDKPPLLGGGVGGVGGGGASGIGRGTNPLFVAAGGGGGGGEGGAGFFGCSAGWGGVGDGRNGVDAAPCANKGIGGLTGGGDLINGGNGCSFCTSAGGGGGGGGYPSGTAGTAGGIGSAGGGGGGGGKSFVGIGGDNFQTFDTAEYRRARYVATIPNAFFLEFRQRKGVPLTSQNGILIVTPIFANFSKPVITPTVNPLQPDGTNGWYRTNISISWQVTSELPITSQTGCGSNVISADTNGVTSSCSATNSAGTTSGSTQTVRRDATLPNITATARLENGTPYTFGTTANQPVTVTFSCSDATSGVAVCPPAQTFGSNAAVSGTVVDRAGNSRTVNFGNVVAGNQPPTISAINDVTTPVNTSTNFIPFTVGDAETPANLLNVTATFTNGIVGIEFQISGNPANRSVRINPFANKVGTDRVTLTVTDQQGASASTSFTVNIQCGAITIEQTFNRINYGSNLYSQIFPSGGVAPYSFEQISGTLPTGSAFLNDVNRFEGEQVRQIGTFPIGLRVTDNNGCRSDVTASVVVDCLINFTVTNPTDTDINSLRFAAAGVCPYSTINFNSSFNNQEVLVNGRILIQKPLTVQGLGADKITVRNVRPNANGSNVFDVGSNDEVTISGMTITGGKPIGYGGGISLGGGNLIVRDSHITGNTADYGGGGIAVQNAASTLTVINSTISNNQGLDNAAQNLNGGGIRSLGPVNIVNSTISGNTVVGSNSAGGVYAPSGLITNSTITGNIVDNSFSGTNRASGVYGGSNNLTIFSSIIAGNQNNATFPDVLNLFTSNGYNLIGNRGAVTAFNQTGDQTGTNAAQLNPMLDVLGMYGGTTPTHRFLSMTSPAIDKGKTGDFTTPALTAALLSADQRGATRPYDNPSISNAAGGDGADIGAFELQSPTAAAVSVSGRVLTADGRGVMNAFVTMTDSSGKTRTARTSAFGYYRLDNVEAGQTYVVAVNSKRFQFAPQVISLTEQFSDLNFIAAP